MAHAHPFGSTAADIKAALRLSRESADLNVAIALSNQANVEAQFAAALAISEEDEDLALICDSLFSVFQQPAVAAYVDGHCHSFEDADYNKLEYTQIHTGYKQLVDELITSELSVLAVTPCKFQRFCEQCFGGERHLDSFVKMQLLSTEDFLVFKQMMINRRRALHYMMPLSITEPTLQGACPTEVPAGVDSQPMCFAPLVGPGQDFHSSQMGLAPLLGRIRARQDDEGLSSTMCLAPLTGPVQAEEHSSLPCLAPLLGPGEANVQPSGVTLAEPVVSYRPKTLLEQPLAFPPDAIEMKQKLDICSQGLQAEVHQDRKRFELFSKRSYIDAELLQPEVVNFGAKPQLGGVFGAEPWLTTQVPSSAQSQGMHEPCQEQGVAPTMEDHQQRAEYWRKQRDLLHSRGGCADVHLNKHAGNPVAGQNDGARLAWELSHPADANVQMAPTVDVAAMRRAMTLQLRGTFDGSYP